MAEVAAILGLIGSIIGILEGVNKIRKGFTQHVHKGSSVQKELIPILGKLTAFTGILRGLQLECDLDESDSARLRAIEHIRAPLEASEKAARAIMARLDQAISTDGTSLTFGKILNKDTTEALYVLQQAKDVLELALDADQSVNFGLQDPRTLIRAIEKYTRTVAEDLRDLREQEMIQHEEVEENFKNMQSTLELLSETNAKEKVLSWVCQVNYGSNYDAARQHVCENDDSGNWFLKSQTFIDWCTATSRSALLLTGASGAGKTVLCSKAISHVQNTAKITAGDPSIMYFFFDFNDILKQSVESMMRALVHQLLRKADGIPPIVQNLYVKHQSSTSIVSSPKLDDWDDVLISLLRDANQPYVFIDALEECADSDYYTLHTAISRFFYESGAHVKLLLTSRPYGRSMFLSDLIELSYLNMEEDIVNKDIQLHLNARLESDPPLSKFGPKAKELISSRIASLSGGMFRYAECQLNVLSKLKDRRMKTIRDILDSMPSTVQSTYLQILVHLHQSQEWPVLERVLTLVSFGARPVTLQEVAEFAILEDGMTTVEPEERFENFNDILAMVSSLISVQDGHLVLAHKSVAEFLNAGPFSGSPSSLADSIIYKDSEVYIAERCLQYLSFPERPAFDFKEYRAAKRPNAEHLSRLGSAYPFLEYAASRWPYHVRSETVRDRLTEKVQRTIPLTAEPNLWRAWILLQRADIWETRLQLARLICEVSVRSSTIPTWACNFWTTRQAYRYTTKRMGVGADDNSPMPAAEEGGSPRSLEVLTKVRNTAIESHSSPAGKYPQAQLTPTEKALYAFAVTMIELALQTSLYPDLELVWLKIAPSRPRQTHLKAMFDLSKYVSTIMGDKYSAVIDECLSVLNSPDGEGPLHAKAPFWSQATQDYAMEKFHDPLQSMLESGFRASRGAMDAGGRLPWDFYTFFLPSRKYAKRHGPAYLSSPGSRHIGTAASEYRFTTGYGKAKTAATSYGEATSDEIHEIYMRLVRHINERGPFDHAAENLDHTTGLDTASKGTMSEQPDLSEIDELDASSEYLSANSGYESGDSEYASVSEGYPLADGEHTSANGTSSPLDLAPVPV